MNNNFSEDADAANGTLAASFHYLFEQAKKVFLNHWTLDSTDSSWVSATALAHFLGIWLWALVPHPVLLFSQVSNMAHVGQEAMRALKKDPVALLCPLVICRPIICLWTQYLRPLFSWDPGEVPLKLSLPVGPQLVG